MPADCTLAIKCFPRSSQPQPLPSTTEFRLKRGAKVRVTLRDVPAHERLGFRRWRARDARRGGRVKVGENQSGLAKVATLGGEDKEGTGRKGGDPILLAAI